MVIVSFDSIKDTIYPSFSFMMSLFGPKMNL